MLPRVDLPELLLEVDAWTGFTSEFSHLAESGTRMEDLAVSACAVLVAEACNIGFTPVTKPGVPAQPGEPLPVPSVPAGRRTGRTRLVIAEELHRHRT
jgi:hypothetical protein